VTSLLTGGLLGLAGSLHCLAMCGPLVAMVSQSLGRGPTVAWYQAGRIGVYAAIGALAGLAGRLAVLSGAGRWLAVAAGIVMLLSAFGRLPVASAMFGRAVTSRLGRVVGRVSTRGRRRPWLAALGLGAVNGLLPCGLVYAAALVAVSTGSIAMAVPTMILFGIGTLPAIVLAWYSVTFVPASLRRRLHVVTPIAVGLVGLLLIGRGLGVGHVHGDDAPGPVTEHHAAHGP